MTTIRPEVPPVIRSRLKLYCLHQRFWLYFHYFVGSVGVLFGVLSSRDGATTWVWGGIAAASTAVVTFLGPQQKGEAYKRAQYQLEHAILRYETVPATTIGWLNRQYREASDIVLSRGAIVRPTPEGGDDASGEEE